MCFFFSLLVGLVRPLPCFPRCNSTCGVTWPPHIPKHGAEKTQGSGSRGSLEPMVVENLNNCGGPRWAGCTSYQPLDQDPQVEWLASASGPFVTLSENEGRGERTTQQSSLMIMTSALAPAAHSNHYGIFLPWRQKWNAPNPFKTQCPVAQRPGCAKIQVLILPDMGFR